HHDVGRLDLRLVALLPVLVLPAPGLQAALDVDLFALLKVFAADLGELLPGDDVVPLGALLLGARGVLPRRGRRDRESRERGALRRGPDLRVLAEVSDQDDFVDAGHVFTLLSGAVTIFHFALGQMMSGLGFASG